MAPSLCVFNIVRRSLLSLSATQTRFNVAAYRCMHLGGCGRTASADIKSRKQSLFLFLCIHTDLRIRFQLSRPAFSMRLPEVAWNERSTLPWHTEAYVVCVRRAMRWTFSFVLMQCSNPHTLIVLRSIFLFDRCNGAWLLHYAFCGLQKCE